MRARFAPSPTGSLHVGNARIAVLNWLLARQCGGTFILRIEDTDLERNQAGAEIEILKDLRWLGLDWDEGPAFMGRPQPGPFGPYRQSERLSGYADAAARLVDLDAAYLCFCTDAEIAERRAAQLARGDAPHYDGRCASLSPDQRAALTAAGTPSTVRFRVPADAEIRVQDASRGEVLFQSSEIGDFVLLRSGGLPTYNFAVVVDDIAMAITHVIRGTGHLSNTPRQQLIYAALGAAPPMFVHVPMVLGPDRQKLSKRHGARALSEYRADGYHPEALVNYLSLLSWSSPSGEEVMTRERLIEEVSLDRLGAADVVFDPAKLSWMSGKHIERMPLADLVGHVRPWLTGRAAELPDEVLSEAVAAIRSRLTTFGSIMDPMTEFFPGGPARLADDAVPVLRASLDVFGSLPAWTRPALDDAIKRIGKETGVRGPGLYQPVRIALTGREHGPALGAVLVVQGRAAVLGALRDTLGLSGV